MMTTRNQRTIRCPEYADSRYLVIDGEVYVNLCAEPGALIAGRFIRTSGGGRGR